MPFITPASTVEANTVDPVATGKRPRKPKRLDDTGKPKSRMILDISDAEKEDIMKAVAKVTGPSFVKEFVFSKGPKDEFLGHAIAEIAKDWNDADTDADTDADDDDDNDRQ